MDDQPTRLLIKPEDQAQSRAVMLVLGEFIKATIESKEGTALAPYYYKLKKIFEDDIHA